jgi:hypothetical protein
MSASRTERAYRVAGRSPLRGGERTCRLGRSRSQFAPERTFSNSNNLNFSWHNTLINRAYDVWDAVSLLDGKFEMVTRRATSIILAAFFAAMTVYLGHATAAAQTAEMRAREDSYLLAYFLDEEPGDVGRAALPETARDVFVVKVNLTRGPIYLVPREMSGVGGPQPEYLFKSWLHVVQVVRGPASVGQQFDVTFGKRNSAGKLTMTPHTRDEVSREYFVIVYVGENGQRHLAGYPITEEKYRAYEAAAMERIKLPKWK